MIRQDAPGREAVARCATRGRVRSFRSRLAGRIGPWAIALAVAARAVHAAPPEQPTFDHDATRFPLTGSHLSASCETCHTGGLFAGTPTDCRSCHGGAEDRAQTRASKRHIPIQGDCSDCHTTRFWEPARMEHGSVGDRCEECHVGNMAQGKPIDHIPSSNQCGDCHGVGTWAGAGFDHAGIVATCVSCHNGTTARGKPPNHIPSSDECDVCHSTQRWSPATAFDHTGITTNCVSCHNGSTATGKPRNHIPSTDSCELCHSTVAWTPAGFDHSNVVPGTCNSCHNGSQATGMPGGHFVTTLSCDTCHTTQAWTPARYVHTGGAYPGDHAANPDCIACHGGNNATVTWSSPAYLPDCAGCHANAYSPNEGGHNGVSVSVNRDCGASGCHSVRDRNWGN